MSSDALVQQNSILTAQNIRLQSEINSIMETMTNTGITIGWYWHKGHEMLPYHTVTSSQIEQAYTTKKKRSKRFMINGTAYHIVFGDPHIQKTERQNQDLSWQTIDGVSRTVMRVKYAQYVQSNKPIQITLTQASNMSDKTQWYEKLCAQKSVPLAQVISDSMQWWSVDKSNPNSIQNHTQFDSEPPTKKRKLNYKTTQED